MGTTKEDKKQYRLLLKQLIGYYENDLAYSDVHEGYIDVEKHRSVIVEMIIAVSKLLNNIRYCSRKDCSCSPESKIKRVYEQNKVVFISTQTALYPIPYEVIEKIVSNS